MGVGAALWAVTALFSTPIWIGTSITTAGRFLINPVKFCKKVDRRQTKYPDSVPGLDHRYFNGSTLGVRLHAATAGLGARRKLMVFLHGFPECWHSWRHQIKEFMKEYEVIALDMRGYNLSTKPKGVKSYAMEHLCADIAGVVAAAGHTSCTLVGHDWGGCVAWCTAANYPKLVEKLIILCSPHPCAYKDPQKFTREQMKRSWYFMLFMGRGLPELWLKSGDFAKVKGMMWDPPMGVINKGSISNQDLEVYKQALARKGAVTAGINYYRASIANDTYSPSEAWQKTMNTQIHAPVLLLYAENDGAFCTSMFQGYEKYAPNITTISLPQCSHWAQQDQPQLVNSHIKTFIQNHDPKMEESTKEKGGRKSAGNVAPRGMSAPRPVSVHAVRAYTPRQLQQQ